MQIIAIPIGKMSKPLTSIAIDIPKHNGKLSSRIPTVHRQFNFLTLAVKGRREELQEARIAKRRKSKTHLSIPLSCG